jgi:hypothetical protein
MDRLDQLEEQDLVEVQVENHYLTRQTMLYTPTLSLIDQLL